ncbi:hypothetical protein BWR16_05930 [Vibrio sp. V01_P9A10T6]|nr:hypothetical protein B9J92_09990 [Vibrio sp. V08_P9A1T1]OXX43133.1 hypothetical protein B9J83_09730 [Vibrio sp. V07_P2A8T137]OXX56284.1 hypothetical protein B9J82_11040 [Vibrio sp. V10_P2A27P122]PRQ63281.1 hypothetical protein BWR16_05930 [Vibrio sp. V01_P9A10T6]PSD40513.1 DUF2063 domain-containing protein [Vibrio sp. V02_P2A34T13]
MNRERQAQWMANILASDESCPEGLTTWNGSDPEMRFAVYRNNVIVSLIDALTDSYPVVQSLVGEAFFQAMAREFIKGHPPSSPVLVWYGSEFPDFITSFIPASGVPYLADVARLEWMRIESWHAADAEPISQETLAAWLSDEVALEQTCFILHPSLNTFDSQYPIASIWSAHQNERVNLNNIDISASEAVVVIRHNVSVAITCLDHHAIHFIKLLNDGVSFAEAVQQAGEFELSYTLAWLIRNQAIINIVSIGSSPCY